MACRTNQTRRKFLKSASLAAGTMLAAGCCSRRRPEMPLMNEPVIDVHVHMAANDAPGCTTSKAMRSKFTWLVRLGVYEDVTTRQLTEDFDGTVRRHLANVIGTAAHVDAAVVLAMDGVYSNGTLDADRTQYMVSNRTVQQYAREHTVNGVLFGASINPERGPEHALAELKRCTGELPWPGQTAPSGPPPALVKWLPNSQEFDPAGRYETFFEALAERNIPLLCHTGKEHTVPTRKAWQKMGDPRRLTRALEMGVTVIAAHCGARTTLLDWKHHYVGALADMLVEAKERGWRLYADVSALSMVFRSSLSVRDVLRRIAEPHGDRLVLGSDYPLPPRSCRSIRNPLDRNYYWLLDRGFPPSIGPAGANILNPKALAWTP